MIVEELLKLKSDKELVTVERDASDLPITGTIHAVDGEIIVMVLYGEDGEYQGWTVFPTIQITEVYWGGQEHRGISRFLPKNVERVIPRFKSHNMDEILIELGGKYDCIAIYEYDEERFNIASIIKHGSEWVKLSCYDLNFSDIRTFKLIHHDNVSRIEIDTPLINGISKLNRSNSQD